MPSITSTPAVINELNRRFWENKTREAQDRMANPSLLRRALADLEGETRRLIPTRYQKPLEEALRDAEALYEDQAIKAEAQRRLSSLGGRATKTDTLQGIIFDEVRRRPNITVKQLQSVLGIY